MIPIHVKNYTFVGTCAVTMPPVNQRLARQVDAIMASLEEALEAGAPVRPPSARPPSDALAYATSPTGAGATSPRQGLVSGHAQLGAGRQLV